MSKNIEVCRISYLIHIMGLIESEVDLAIFSIHSH